jgi:hypothetical protein
MNGGESYIRHKGSSVQYPYPHHPGDLSPRLLCSCGKARGNCDSVCLQLEEWGQFLAYCPKLFLCDLHPVCMPVPVYETLYVYHGR